MAPSDVYHWICLLDFLCLCWYAHAFSVFPSLESKCAPCLDIVVLNIQERKPEQEVFLTEEKLFFLPETC